ncbi:MAG: DUF86 domain-containing protein [Candidatus Thermoplasmatota archaeon]|nr:DUF86 domain-containing protein [Candidatus Thermoplasmatota archaeon]MBS3790448.1 DUF86 domain-containing protein [Candidatus Thermoplasmatota archaeon]
MDNKRVSRYKEKLSLIDKRKNNISNWIDHRDEKSVLAIYKAYQEMIEALTDIFAMMIKDLDEVVKDDYSNIDKLKEKGIMSDKRVGLMKEANGLRNRLVHEYNGLERKTALSSLKRINSEVDDILEEVRKWITKHSKS